MFISLGRALLRLAVPALALAPVPQLQAQSRTVLVEAEGFDTIGGWKVDTQFVETMGSVCLIAHGMGKPVADAVKQVTFPAAGDYRVWVRTRNWVPGNWQAPGRFQLRVQGELLPSEFGTTSESWAWQDGGTVTITSTTASLELHDLTGFNGRCDAIAFIAGSDSPPPADPAELKSWRRNVLDEAPAPGEIRRFDCVIAGGGMAGCCAAIAAARSGVQVALIQDRPVLGGNASQEIRVATRGEIRHPIVDEIDTLSLGNRDAKSIDADQNRLNVILKEPNITLLMPWRAEDAGTDPVSKAITHIDVRQVQSGARLRLQAPLFIDCTGDGWIGFWAGADYRMGWESAAEFGESLGKSEFTAMTMGNTLMWKTKTGTVDSTFPDVPWAMDVAGTKAATGGDWDWEYGMRRDTIYDAEHIRDHLLRAIYGNFSNAKKLAANSKLELEWVPYVAGKRESRRLMGDHIVTQNDMVSGLYFEDAVGTTDWGIDLHYETATSYISTYKKTGIAKPSYFPYRSLYSRNIPNLFMAGRNFSCTHAGLGSPRVMNTTGQMGVAVGYAAALCKQYHLPPRDIYRIPERMTELQARITGTWPAKPVATGTTMDNSDAAGVVTIGDWTTSNSIGGYHGSDYVYSINTPAGTKSLTYTPVGLASGSYTVSLKWTQHANRNPAAPVWIFNSAAPATTIANPGIATIRNAQPNTPQTGTELLVGRYAASDFTRGLLNFDLSSLPARAVIRSAELILTSPGKDATSATGGAGAEGLKLYQITEPFDPTQATWNQRNSSTAWTTAGASLSPTLLGSIPTPPDHTLVTAGQTFNLGSAELGKAIDTTRKSASPVIHLALRTPTLESSYNSRKLYRFSTAVLKIHAHIPQLPATTTVDQRSNGSSWVNIGDYAVGADGITVVIGNDGPANTYTVADGVMFTPPGGDADRDGDQLPDWWERWNFLSETSANPADDSDRDGQCNAVEFLTGCDPNLASSHFDARLALDRQSGGCHLRWPSAEGRLYTIESSADCVTWQPFIRDIPATPPNNETTAPIEGERRFFRVVVSESNPP